MKRLTTALYLLAALSCLPLVSWGQATAPYVLPPATATHRGGVKVGSGLAVSQDGTLSATYSYTLTLGSLTALLGGTYEPLFTTGSGLTLTSGVLSVSPGAVFGGVTLAATGLSAGASPTLVFSGGTLTIGVPAGQQGAQGNQGIQGVAGQNGSNGSNGAPGSAATVGVGTVIALPYGTPPTVTNGGTSSAATLNFGLETGPQGVQGNPGTPGTNGTNGAVGPNWPIVSGSVSEAAPAGLTVTGNVTASDTGHVVTLTIPSPNYPVTSVFGRTGAVTLQLGDITAGLLATSPASGNYLGYNGSALAWSTPPVGPTYTAGSGIGISGGAISESLPITAVGTNLSLSGGTLSNTYSYTPPTATATAQGVASFPTAGGLTVSSGAVSEALPITAAGTGIGVSGGTVSNTGVTSFNTRTGPVTLVLTDISSLLGITGNGTQATVGGTVDTGSRFQVAPSGTGENGVSVVMPSGATGYPFQILTSTRSQLIGADATGNLYVNYNLNGTGGNIYIGNARAFYFGSSGSYLQENYGIHATMPTGDDQHPFYVDNQSESIGYGVINHFGSHNLWVSNEIFVGTSPSSTTSPTTTPGLVSAKCLALSVRTVTASTDTATNADSLIELGGSVAQTETLPTPSATNKGQTFIVVDQSGQSDSVSATVLGSPSLALSAVGAFDRLESDGTQYIKL